MFWPWGPTLESLPPMTPLWTTEVRQESVARERVRRAIRLLRRARGRREAAEERGRRAPGVAEVIEAYGRTAPPPGGWRPLNVGPLRYATGTEEEG